MDVTQDCLQLSQQYDGFATFDETMAVRPASHIAHEGRRTRHLRVRSLITGSWDMAK